MQRGTLRLRAGDDFEDAAVQMSLGPAALAGCDVVLLTTKSQATDEALQAARPYLGNAIVLAIQNGVSDEPLTRHIPDERLAVAMTAINAAILAPGEVSLQLDGMTIVGRRRGPRHAAAIEAAALLRQSDMATDLSDNMPGVQYNKLTLNAVGYASCLSQSNFITEAVTHRPWRQHVGRPLVDECLGIYCAGRHPARADPRPARPRETAAAVGAARCAAVGIGHRRGGTAALQPPADRLLAATGLGTGPQDGSQLH